MRHARARGTPLEVTPAGAVGSFFIPFVNLVRPYAIAKQIAADDGAVQLVTTWQAAWLGGNLSSNVGSRRQGGASHHASVIVDLPGSLIPLGAAFACGRVVDELTRTTELTAPSASPAQAGPPPTSSAR